MRVCHTWVRSVKNTKPADISKRPIPEMLFNKNNKKDGNIIMILCGDECSVCCDFCNYNNKAIDPVLGINLGKGYCKINRKDVDAGDECEKFRCFRVTDEQIENLYNAEKITAIEYVESILFSEKDKRIADSQIEADRLNNNHDEKESL